MVCELAAAVGLSFTMASFGVRHGLMYYFWPVLLFSISPQTISQTGLDMSLLGRQMKIKRALPPPIYFPPFFFLFRPYYLSTYNVSDPILGTRKPVGRKHRFFPHRVLSLKANKLKQRESKSLILESTLDSTESGKAHPQVSTSSIYFSSLR